MNLSAQVRIGQFLTSRDMALDKYSNQDIGHVLFQHLFHAWSVSHDINSSLARGHAFNQHLRFARELAGWYQNATNSQNSESDKVAHFQAGLLFILAGKRVTKEAGRVIAT